MSPTTRLLACAALGAAACIPLGSQAAGPLNTTDNPARVIPWRWDMSRGPIPVYTDLGAFTYNNDGSVFLSNAQADAITGFALAQWSDVPTSTWRAQIANFTKFDQVPSIGGDVAGHGQLLTINAVRTLQPGEVGPERVYGVFNGGGLYVNYDTDGSILETFFGVPRNQVLGIAFPEWADDLDGDGYPETIVEATAVMNGWFVHVSDTQGARVAGVFTHEFGHAINLSHSQVNGPMGYQSTTAAPKYPGVKGCVAPIYRWDSASSVSPRLDPKYIETMFPFIDSISLKDGRSAGAEQSTVDLPDDIAAISNLYPAATYLGNTGSISGVLRLKDGRTPYSGVNVIARNVANPLGDAVSAMTGDQTQGKVGPDGRFNIRGLTPGQSYVLYIEAITSGGYPTRPMPLVSEGEYWDIAEGSNPATDAPCNATPITAIAGGTVTADITFNGYAQGVQYTPIVAAFLSDLAKNGSKSAGVAGSTAFLWEANKGFTVLPSSVKAAGSPSISRNGGVMTAQIDFNGNGVQSAALWNSANNRLTDLGSLNGDTCGGASSNGVSSVSAWALDDAGTTMVGLGYVDVDGNGVCQQSFRGEILPAIWTAKNGMRTLSTQGFDLTKLQYVRAHAISGDGSLILGAAPATQKAVAWIGQDAAPVDLSLLTDATGRSLEINDAYASNRDGSLAALSTRTRGMVLWRPRDGTGPTAFSFPAGPEYCTDAAFPFFRFGINQCTVPTETPASIKARFGVVPVLPTDMSDDGRVIVARAGTAGNGFVGMMWIDGLGWFKFRDFFRQQGVAEAYALGIENPLSLNGAGNELVGGLPGIQMSWYVDMKQAFVCQDGTSVQTGFPGGFIDAVKAGARPGRCEHL